MLLSVQDININDEDMFELLQLPVFQLFEKSDIVAEVNFDEDISLQKEKFIKTVQYIVQNSKQIEHTLLLAIVEYYKKQIIPKKSQYETVFKITLSDIHNPDEIKNLVKLRQIFLHLHHIDQYRFGFLFSCSWDREHGLGVAFSNLCLKGVGNGDISFRN